MKHPDSAFIRVVGEKRGGGGEDGSNVLFCSGGICPVVFSFCTAVSFFFKVYRVKS